LIGEPEWQIEKGALKKMHAERTHVDPIQGFRTMNRAA
jgi:hypothetical protein